MVIHHVIHVAITLIMKTVRFSHFTSMKKVSPNVSACRLWMKAHRQSILLPLFVTTLILLGTADLFARCIVGIWVGDRYKHFIINTTCAEVNECLSSPPKCVDLPIAGGCSVDVQSATEAYVVFGKEKFLLASDEAQVAFDAMWKKKKGKINSTELQRTLAPLIKKNGRISTQRISAITKGNSKR